MRLRGVLRAEADVENQQLIASEESGSRHPQDDPRVDSARAWLRFGRERVPLLVFALLSGGTAASSLLVMSCALTVKPLLFGFVFQMLFYTNLRLMDELKDVDKDRIGHPERPLPRGLLTIDAVRGAVQLLTLAMLLCAVLGYMMLSPMAAALMLLVTCQLLIMYFECGCAVWLERSPILVLLTHQPIVSLMTICVCTLAQPTSYFSLKAYSLSALLQAGFLTYEVCRKLDPTAHKVLGTYLVTYGRVTTFAIIAVANAVGGGGAYLLATATDERWPLYGFVTPQLLIVMSTLILFAMPEAHRSKRHKVVELLSALSLLWHVFLVPIAATATGMDVC
mmetsp:Transcript_22275/g.36872  ORF Transcript_22275/g.36872 Transcript_22275/m.36872 type:complete len:337 (+) Transcript_22275:3-1013(+)